MNINHINTYCNGFDLYPITDITKNDFVNICLDLNQAFNNEYEFEIEGMCDGFIYYKNLKNDNKYKCMRLSGNKYRTPWINDNSMMEWKDNNDVLLYKVNYNINKKKGKKGEGYSTFLKSFYNAPKWTIEELDIFSNVFIKHNIYTSNYKRIRLNY